MDKIIKKNEVGVAAIGGLGEIGKNTYAIQYRDEIVIIDAGVKFPGDNILGIDYVIPDYSYIEKNVDKIKALIITHGHEDHIGGLPFLLRKVNLPIYGGPLAIGLIRSKLEEHNLLAKAELNVIDEDTVLSFKYLKVSFHNTTHSIPDSFGVIVNTPQGNIVHTGDFKFDFTPVGQGTNLHKMAAIGEQGVLCLLSDSTNSERTEFTQSEKEVGKTISNILRKEKHRVIFATFASNVYRVKQVVEACIEHGRKIVVFGRSMEKAIKIGTELGYIKAPKETFVNSKYLNQVDPNKLLILCTGTQGEPLAALSRIAKDMHKHIVLREGDTVIISSTPIPGNEKAVSTNINNILKYDVDLVFKKLAGIHVSGHGSKEEQKLMLNLINPKHFMPVHGEYRMLKAHMRSAIETGVPKDKILLTQNGDKVEVTKEYAKINGKVNSGEILVDGLGVGDIGSKVIKDRQQLSEDGIVIVAYSIDKETGKIVSGPEMSTKGFVYYKDSEDTIKEAQDLLAKKINKNETYLGRDWADLKGNVRDLLSRFFYEKLKRNPIILPMLLEI